MIVDGHRHHVAFKSTGFRVPWVSDKPIDISALIEKEEPLMKKLDNAYRKKNAENVAAIESECILPALIAPYVESEQKSNRLFDLLDVQQFKIASTPKEKAVELADENEALKEENETLKAQIAELSQAQAGEADEEGEKKTEAEVSAETPKE